MLINPAQQKGLTLVEMMIAMVLGLFVTAVIISVFSTNVRTNVENMKMIRLNQELRGAMTFMVDELKRTGYSADSTEISFMASFERPNSSCILYSYDLNGNGDRDSNEHFGFRLDTTAKQIKWASNASAASSTTCNSFGESITDVNMAEITTLEFDFSGSGNKLGSTINTGIVALTTSTGVSLYDVTITLTGKTDLPHSSDANDPRRTLIETIRIRNDDPKD
ncbi:type IV pilin [Cycloclasticus sp. 46_120_T64]|nr:type IV pilin [Cycloclasticus sp. 46_120_T64]